MVGIHKGIDILGRKNVGIHKGIDIFEPKNCRDSSLEIDPGIFISSANPALSKIIIFPPWYYEGHFLTFSNQKIVSWNWSGNFHFKRKSCIE